MADYLLGFDIGSSSIKASLLDVATGTTVASATSPDTELEMLAVQPGWAEQHPDTWWEHMRRAVQALRETHAVAVDHCAAVGIAYQMHGLVITNSAGEVLRPAIIWCDSRAVPYGERALAELGEKKTLERLLNSPGNFTASKLAWVKEHEPDLFAKVDRMMLPGDYLAYRMTGELLTTVSGLSEGILWDSSVEAPAKMLLDHYGFPESILPQAVPSFSEQGRITTSAAKELGVPAGIPVTYRAGDQPNNAFSLNALRPGELAATAGTSGVVYAVVDRPAYDQLSRVNTFVHVNHTPDARRYGVLLCINGTGICNRWMKQQTLDGAGDIGGAAASYPEMNAIAATAPIGAEQLVVLPFGNGAERVLQNRDPGASVQGLNFNRHTRAHLLRAAQEGIAFAMGYGVQVMREMGLEIGLVRAGYANMFQSQIFREAFASVGEAEIRLYATDGSEGAARGAGVGAGAFTLETAFTGLEQQATVSPQDIPDADRSAYRRAYERWEGVLNRQNGVS